MVMMATMIGAAAGGFILVEWLSWDGMGWDGIGYSTLRQGERG